MIDERSAIGSCHELKPGDTIEAFHENNLVHRGPVTHTLPELGLFWILDNLTGGRRLLDMSELEIVRLPAHYRDVSAQAHGQHDTH